MSQSEQQPLSPDFSSPHKSARGENGGDVTRNSHIRTESERPSPGPLRKVSGQGSRSSTPRNVQDVFSVGDHTPNQNPEGYVLGTAPQTRSHTGHGEQGSPSPSSRGGLDTGHHATDFEGSEDGEIRENGRHNADGEDDTMPLATAIQNAAGNAEAATEPMAVDENDDLRGAGHREHRPVMGGERVELGEGGAHAFIFEDEAQADTHARLPQEHRFLFRQPVPGAQAPPPAPQAPQPAAGPAFFRGPAQAMVAAAVGAAGIRAVDAAGALGITVAAANAAMNAIANGAVGVVFVLPDLAEHARAPPTHMDESPHRMAPATPLPDPEGPEDLTRTKIQPNTGNFPEPVMSADRLHENVDELTLQLFCDSPGTHLYAVTFNGGIRMRKQLGGGKNTSEGDKVIAEALTKGIANLANPATTSVFPVLEKKAASGGNYAGTIVVAIEAEDAGDYARLVGQKIIAIDRTFAFWIVSPGQLTVPWIATIVSPSTGGGTIGAERALRATMSKFMWEDDNFGLALARMTSTTDKSPLIVRRYKLSQTLHSVYNELTKDYAVYLKPCTTDPVQWREFTAIIQRQKFSDGRYIFESKINPDTELLRPGPRCVTCKNEDHYEAGCGTAKHKDFWGPTGQLRDATEGLLAQPNGGRNGGGGRGAPRGQPRGNFRGRTRGRGGY
ncbi:hypothetical protein C8R45DRAFT_230734 [Mycena sanguinolenta]|nr:hypothetical protein C8R45DRAFT_230734 [Mycena sanguinolenta]